MNVFMQNIMAQTFHERKSVQYGILFTQTFVCMFVVVMVFSGQTSWTGLRVHPEAAGRSGPLDPHSTERLGQALPLLHRGHLLHSGSGDSGDGSCGERQDQEGSWCWDRGPQSQDQDHHHRSAPPLYYIQVNKKSDAQTPAVKAHAVTASLPPYNMCMDSRECTCVRMYMYFITIQTRTSAENRLVVHTLNAEIFVVACNISWLAR